MDPPPSAYTHVHRSNTWKKATTGTFINVQGPLNACTGGTQKSGRLKARGSTSSSYTYVQSLNTRKKAAKGTWIHVQVPIPTCTCRTHGKKRLQLSGTTCRGLQPRAQVEHMEKSDYENVDQRPWTYTHVYRWNTRERAATGT